VFEVRDETAAVDCAAFEEAGVRAYPKVEVGDLVRIDGEVRLRRDELQVETEALTVLDGEEAATVEDRMARAMEERARPDEVAPLADDTAVAGVVEDVADAAAAIRRAVLESRPVVVRHAASTDGYVAGTAIERAVLPLVREEHAQTDAAYHYFDRRPLEDGVYAMDDATMDVTKMLDDRERHDEKLPLFVFAGAGSGADSLDGLEFVDVYDAERVVVDGGHRGSRVDAGEGAVAPEAREAADVAVAPEEPTTASAVAATLGAAVNDDVREDLRHLPAVSFWDDAPDAYVSLAAEAGYDADELADVREAVALEAYYQSYEDKRELIADLLFEERGLAEQVARQFRTERDDELGAAEANVDRHEVGDEAFAVLDTDAFTHRYEFPPTDLLLDELHRRNDAAVTVGLGEDDLRLRADADLDLRDIAADVREQVGDAGVTVRDGPSPRLEFLSGERDAVLEATLDAVAGVAGEATA
jgi:RecJ-like exonuclease